MTFLADGDEATSSLRRVPRSCAPMSKAQMVSMPRSGRASATYRARRWWDA